jgi:hypothetical protein
MVFRWGAARRGRHDLDDDHQPVERAAPAACGVLVAVYWFKLGLVAIWGVLCAELCLRGVMLYLRFLGGAWKRVQV